MTEPGDSADWLDARYRMVRDLGHGGMGRVVLVTDALAEGVPSGDGEADDGHWAIKILERPALEDAFLRAFRLHRTLAHPAFAQARDLGVDQHTGRLYAVFEWCRGTPLEPGTVADGGEILEIVGGLLRGIDHLHRLGYVHGDLAPANVLATVEGRQRVKILDLGSAGPEGSGAGSTSGVMSYAAPERLEGKARSAQADLWSVGALAFGLVHGAHPFPGYPGPLQDGARPDRHGSQPHELDPWLDRLLSVQPGDRYPTAAAALEALEDACAAPVASATPWEIATQTEHVPFVDVRGHLDHLVGRLQSAANAGRPRAVSIGGATGAGRSRLLDELCHRLVAAGLPVARGRFLPTDGVGDVLRRVGQQLGGPRVEHSPADGTMGAARAVLNAARDRGSPMVVILDDIGQADDATRRGVAYLAETVERAPDRAGGLLLVTTDGQADVVLEPWEERHVDALVQALFPARRIGTRVTGPLWERARGLPGPLAALIHHAARVEALHVNTAAVKLDGAALDQGREPTVAAMAEAKLAELSESCRREAALLAHARDAVPTELCGPQVAQLVQAEIALVMSADGEARVALRSEGARAAAAAGLEPGEAWSCWADRWGARAETSPQAEGEALWYAYAADPEAAQGRARSYLLEARAEDAGALAALLVTDDWPGAGEDAITVGRAAEASGDLVGAAALYGRVLNEKGVVGVEARLRAGLLQARQARHAAALEHFQAGLDLVGDQDDALRMELLAAASASAAQTGRLDEATGWASEGLSLTDEAPSAVRGRLLYAQGLVGWYRQELDGAGESLAAALESVGPDGDRVDRAAVLTALGLIAHGKDAYEEAVSHYEEALALGEAAGDDARILTALMNLGVVYQEQGAYGAARDTYEEAMAMAEALGQTGRVIQLCGNLGNLWRYLGELGQAEGVLERGLTLSRRESNRYMEGLLLTRLGEVALADEQWTHAETMLLEAVTAAVECQSVAEEIEARLDLARLHLERQDYGGGRHQAQTALDRAQHVEGDGYAAEAMALLAAAHGRSIHGDEQEAHRMASLALAAVDSVRLKDGVWPIWLEAFHDARRREDGVEATRCATEVRRILRQLEDAVPARQRVAFRGLRERQRAWRETTFVLEGSGAPNRRDAGTVPESWARLLEVNKRLSSQHQVERLLEYVMDSAVLLSGAERGFLLLAGGEGAKDVEVMVARNLDQENIKRTRMKISHGIARKVIETGEAVLTIDAMADDRYRDQLSVHDLKLRSVLCLPLIHRTGVLGALYLDNRFRTQAFQDDTVGTMEAFCDQAAIALANARLMEAMEASSQALERSRQDVEALNARLQEDLAHRTQELEETHRVVVRQRTQLQERHRYDSIIGDSEALGPVFDTMDRLLDNTIPVLIEGESGTGKELVARAIHFTGSRKEGPFVAINCGAIPANLLESELFGHVRGAFTGATHDKKGVFQAAQLGTLLLDELGELPLEMQVALLRVLQSGEVRPVGSTDVMCVDVRIIAATNRKLAEEVQGGRFREDLYYRLAVIPITVPPLRERKEDLPVLAQHFIDANRAAGIGQAHRVGKKALAHLARYHWPGNVRQLEMVLKNASLFSDGEVLAPEDFEAFPDIAGGSGSSAAAATLSGRTLADIERDAIIQALEDNRGNKKRSAEQLGIDRRTLYNKLASYKIVVEKDLKVR